MLTCNGRCDTFLKILISNCCDELLHILQRSWRQPHKAGGALKNVELSWSLGAVREFTWRCVAEVEGGQWSQASALVSGHPADSMKHMEGVLYKRAHHIFLVDLRSKHRHRHSMSQFKKKKAAVRDTHMLILSCDTHRRWHLTDIKSIHRKPFVQQRNTWSWKIIKSNNYPTINITFLCTRSLPGCYWKCHFVFLSVLCTVLCNYCFVLHKLFLYMFK